MRRVFSRVMLAGSIAAVTLSPGFGQQTTPQTNPQGGQNQNRTPQTTTPRTGADDRTSTNTAQTGRPVDRLIEMNMAEVEISKVAQQKAQNQEVKSFADMMVRDHTQALTKLQPFRTSTTSSSSTSSSTSQRSSSSSSTTQGGNQSPSTRPGTSSSSSSSQQPGTSQSSSSTSPNTAGLNQQHQETVMRISKLSGNSFDREYMNVMVTDHRQAVTLLEEMSGQKGTSSSSDTRPGTTSQSSSRSSTSSQDSTSSRQGAQGSAQESPRSSTSSQQSTRSGASDQDLAKVAQELLPIVRRHLESAQKIQKSLQASNPSTPAQQQQNR